MCMWRCTMLRSVLFSVLLFGSIPFLLGPFAHSAVAEQPSDTPTPTPTITLTPGLTDTPTSTPTPTPVLNPPPGLPDLTVAVTAPPVPVPAGAQVLFNVTISNEGAAPSAATTLSDVIPPGAAPGLVPPGCRVTLVEIVCPVPSVPAGGSASLVIGLVATGDTPVITNGVVVDPANQVTETDETNNVDFVGVPVLPPPPPPPQPPA